MQYIYAEKTESLIRMQEEGAARAQGDRRARLAHGHARHSMQDIIYIFQPSLCV